MLRVRCVVFNSYMFNMITIITLRDSGDMGYMGQKAKVCCQNMVIQATI